MENQRGGGGSIEQPNLPLAKLYYINPAAVRSVASSPGLPCCLFVLRFALKIRNGSRSVFLFLILHIQVASIAALTAAIIAVVKAVQIPDLVSTADVVRNSKAVAGLVIAVVFVGVLVEVGVLVVRFLNFGLLIIISSIFLIIVRDTRQCAL